MTIRASVWRRRVRVVVAGLALVFAGPASSAGPDLHRLWDTRCHVCHGHAGPFARRHLQVRDGVLHGARESRDLKIFLRNHYPADADVDDLYAMLLAQAESEPRFKAECAACHGSAVALVRASVDRHDGALRVRNTGQPLADFLSGHAGLDAAGVARYMDLLGRVHDEVHR